MIKQSSIEWLFEQVCNLDWKNLQGEKKLEILEQAKAMHKEEIMDANFFGQRLHAKSVTNTMMEDNAEGYYNETFNTKEK